MPLKAILGRKLESQNFTATWGVNTCTEEWLVEMDSPLEDQATVALYLPAYGQTEPTFTIGRSPHPSRPDLVLKSCDGIREAPDGRPFWVVSVTYETPQFMNEGNLSFPREDQGKGNIARKKRIDPATNDSIIEPWNEPPTWSSSTRTVQVTRYHDANNVLLRHANGLPLTEGIQSEIILEVHQFTWNVRYSTFTYTTKVRPFINKLNSTTCFGRPPGYVLCESITCTENYRDATVPTPDGQSTTIQTYHFVTLNATFVIDRRQAFANSFSYFREAYRRVSMHTVERILLPNPVTGIVEATYLPININARGDVAEAPWPLLSSTKAAALGKQLGQAVPYAIMDTIDPLTDFHYIDLLLPESADLEDFRDDNDLVIP
jgi:hypothetical protein